MKEAIAIVGMSGRFPGAANPDLLWDLLIEGRSPLREIPPERWDAQKYYSTDESVAGKMYVKQGYFLDDIDQFDPQFFRISPKDALTLDPQHRLLLEVSWEAFTSAGMPTANLLNTNTAVFVGLMNHDYWHLMTRHARVDQTSFIAGMGNSSHCAAGRIAYTFGLQGPCATIDTACSSSLVALHQACQALRQHDCDLALAGAVNLILDPYLMVSMCNGKVLARDGRCKSFDASADGYGRGEGCGVLILKRLSDAQKNNDRILAVIRGSAVNQNGSGNGMTVPNGEAQRALLQKALQAAQLSAHEIDYLEAHGSATQLGDLIEMNSIAAVMGNDDKRKKPLYISSVKPNIGHLESASGMAGLFKVILSLHHQQIPKHLHLSRLNPHFDLSSLQAVIPEQSVAWQRGEKPRIAGISSFGISGTNAHVIIAESEQSLLKQFAVHHSFQRKPYWIEKPEPAASFRLPGAQLCDIKFKKEVSLSDQDYLADHQIHGEIIYPAAGFIDLALGAAKMLRDTERAISLDNLNIEHPLRIKREVNSVLYVAIHHENAAYEMQINSESGERHARLTFSTTANINAAQELRAIQGRCRESIHTQHYYEQLNHLGLNYGSRMRSVQGLWRGYNEALAKLVLPASSASGNYHCHPVLLDGAFQALAMNIFMNQSAQGEPQFYLPVGMNKIVYHSKPGREVYVHMRYLNTDIALDVIEADINLYDETGNLLLHINKFYLKRANRPAVKSEDNYFYIQTWQSLSIDQVVTRNLSESLIVGNPDGLGLIISEKLNARLYSDVDAITAPRQIIYLESLVNESEGSGVIKLLHFLQSLQQRDTVPDIFIFTHGACKAANENNINLQQAMLWGMLQCARHEWMRGKLHIIDLDPDISDVRAQAAAVVAELGCADHEAKIAIRGNQRLGLRLSRLPAVKTDAEKTLTGTYLVTGGLGGLGLASVEWLVQRGVRHIALISRSKPDHAASELLQQLKNQGVHVTAFQADVSNKAQLQQILDAIRQPNSGFLPLRGIIHSAGILSDGMITSQTEDKFKQVFSAKIAGAWNLHELTLQDNLEKFILFSSIASVIGAPGQTNYGAANAFLDALAQYRHLHGLPALSINWGPWSEVGMARSWSDLHGARGVSGFPTQKGIGLLNTAITLSDYKQLVIADIDWTRFAVSITPDMRAYLSSLVDHHTYTDAPQSDDLQTLVARTLKSTLGFAMDDKLGADDNFFDLGMDSLLAMQFNESLKNALKDSIELPMVAIFQHPTMNSLITHIQSLQEM